MENRFRSALDALDRARRPILIYALVVVALTAVAFSFSERLLLVLVRLLGRRPVAYDPSEAFLGLLALSVYAAVALSLPAGAWMLWRGAASRFFPDLRGAGGLVIAAAALLFAAGVLLGYSVLLPAGVRFLTGFETPETRALLSVRKFISFCGAFLLALGLAFEAPLAAFLLARAGWARPSFFRRNWRHAIVGCTVAAAILTPTPDVYNLALMGLPLLGLYFVSWGVVAAVARTRGDGRRRGPREVPRRD